MFVPVQSSIHLTDLDYVAPETLLSAALQAAELCGPDTQARLEPVLLAVASYLCGKLTLLQTTNRLVALKEGMLPAEQLLYMAAVHCVAMTVHGFKARREFAAGLCFVIRAVRQASPEISMSYELDWQPPWIRSAHQHAPCRS
jgi:hypothetical protein